MADIILLVATLGLSVAIVPTLRSSFKPPLLTSFGFTICVFMISGALFSAGLWLGGGANALAGTLWTGVVLQTITARKE